MVNVSVGILASLISVTTLIITTVFQRVCERIADISLKSKLIADHNGPLISGTDFCFMNAFSSMYKFRKNPGM